MLRKAEVDNIIKDINNLIKIDYPYYKIEYSYNVLDERISIDLLNNPYHNVFSWDFTLVNNFSLDVNNILKREDQLVDLENQIIIKIINYITNNECKI